MPECDYCGESFDGEGAYLDHLAAEHEGELGAIDRRRVEDRESSGGLDLALGPLILVGLLVIAGGVVVYVTFLMGGDGATASASGLEAEPLPEQGSQSLLDGVERFESEGRDHVEPGTDIDYERVPPTSGPHYPSNELAAPGFYETTPALGGLVHNLEHGHVVIYYDPSAITPEAEQSLTEFAGAHTADWASVVVVPNPREDPRGPYVLTAWRTRLVMDGYDNETVRAFLAEYLGRGPENAVR